MTPAFFSRRFQKWLKQAHLFPHSTEQRGYEEVIQH